jgi:hypothetical protein
MPASRSVVSAVCRSGSGIRIGRPVSASTDGRHGSCTSWPFGSCTLGWVGGDRRGLAPATIRFEPHTPGASSWLADVGGLGWPATEPVDAAIPGSVAGRCVGITRRG